MHMHMHDNDIHCNTCVLFHCRELDKFHVKSTNHTDFVKILFFLASQLTVEYGIIFATDFSCG